MSEYKIVTNDGDQQGRVTPLSLNLLVNPDGGDTLGSEGGLQFPTVEFTNGHRFIVPNALGVDQLVSLSLHR